MSGIADFPHGTLRRCGRWCGVGPSFPASPSCRPGAPARLSWILKNKFTNSRLSRLNVSLILWFIVHSRNILYESKDHRCFARPLRRVVVPPFSLCTSQKSKAYPTLCRAYTGYVDVGSRHLFFTFVEKQSQPTTMWSF